MKTNKKFFLLGVIAITMIISACSPPSVSEANEVQSSESIQMVDVNNNSHQDNNYITQAGTYTYSGEIPTGIFIEVSKDEEVELVLNGVEISTDSDKSPVYIKEAKDVKIILSENTQNNIIDNRSQESDEEDFPNAAIYSMSDLKIEGADSASLNIVANLNDGITSKDDLVIQGINLKIESADDGIRGKDSVEIIESNIVIDAADDGIKSDNEDDETRGWLSISESDIQINAGDDGIKAIQVLDVLSGNINIQQSYEGLEAKKINIYDGVINIVSKDDALNVAYSVGAQESVLGFFGQRGGGESVLDGGMLSIYGGKITINAEGDGFDSNGNAQMTGGVLIVDGPAQNGNGAIDVNGEFNVSGGEIIAIGSSGMAETPSESSSQLSLQVNFESSYNQGTTLSLLSSNGEAVFSYVSKKSFQSITYSSPDLVVGETYTLNINGEKYTDLKLNQTVTIEGQEFKRGPGGGGRRM